MEISNLAGVFTGSGFAAHEGRHPHADHAGWMAGPVTISVDDGTGTITRVEKGRSASPTGFNGEGLVATAGWIDSHTHAIYGGQRAGEYFARWGGQTYAEIAAAGGGIHNTNRDTSLLDDDRLASALTERCRDIFRHGTTTFEIKTGYAAEPEGELRLLRLLKRIRAQWSPAKDLPDIKTTFLALHALPKGTPEADFVNGRISILETIRAEALADYADAFPEKGFFSLEESLRFTRAAQAVGLQIKIHADELSPLGSTEAFALGGALSVDHLQHVSRRGLEALAKAKTVATLLPSTSFYLNLPYAPAQDLLRAGARVALATDYNPGTAPEPRFGFTQLLAATQYKMSPAEILCASTYSAAQALGLADRGCLSPGQRGDILLWEPAAGTPSNSPTALEEILLGASRLVKVLSGKRA